jgi:hypothetical protein
MNSDETVKNAGDMERAQLTDNSVGQQLRSDELSLERLYIELTGASEAQARSVFMFMKGGATIDPLKDFSEAAREELRVRV